MCQMCQLAASGVEAAVSPHIFAAMRAPPMRLAAADHLEAKFGAASSPPEGVGKKGRRTLIKGGVIVSMDEQVGNFAVGDVLIEGAKIVQVGASIEAPDAAVIDAAGHIVIPGFIDTHHHQFETALRGALADAILINDGRPESANNLCRRCFGASGSTLTGVGFATRESRCCLKGRTMFTFINL